MKSLKKNKKKPTQSGLGGNTLSEISKLNSGKDGKRYKKNRNVNEDGFNEYQADKAP